MSALVDTCVPTPEAFLPPLARRGFVPLLSRLRWVNRPSTHVPFPLTGCGRHTRFFRRTPQFESVSLETDEDRSGRPQQNRIDQVNLATSPPLRVETAQLEAA